MNRTITTITLFLLIMLLCSYGCKKEEPTSPVNKVPIAPSNPNPPDNGTGRPNLILSWTCNDPDSNLLTYDIYFGTDNPPTTKISTNHTVTNLQVNDLIKNTRYFWRVVAKYDDGRSTSSEVWKFSANNPPNIPSNPNPPHNAMGRPINLFLSWTCSDLDNDPLTYDVYFGKDNPPATKVSLGQ
ncbi:MAG: fibronectin type III domain-containing protein, partial [Ignavibacteriae bacterium]|nr:fibronectin type III domain-containing protein [Ignavibacteriota bacterium]